MFFWLKSESRNLPVEHTGGPGGQIMKPGRGDSGVCGVIVTSVGAPKEPAMAPMLVTSYNWAPHEIW